MQQSGIRERIQGSGAGRVAARLANQTDATLKLRLTTGLAAPETGPDRAASRPLQGVHGVGRQIEFEGIRAQDQLNAFLWTTVGEHDDKAAIGIAKTGVRNGAGSSLPFANAIGLKHLGSATNVFAVMRKGPVLAALRDLVSATFDGHDTAAGELP